MDDSDPRIVSDTIRYRGKAVDDRKWIVEFLAGRETGVLGLQTDGAPHLVTQLFVYCDEERAIFVHGANAGQAYDIVEENGGVSASFTTSRMGRFIPADQPVNFTVEYESVVANGTVEIVTSPAKKRAVLERFMGKFAPHLTPGKDYEEIREDSVDRTAVYKLNVETWSAKKGEKPPDHPGAYDLSAVSESNR